MDWGRTEEREGRREGRWEMGHVSEGRSGALSEERGGGRFSNLRCEMNGKGSCGERGEENEMRRWKVDKKRQTTDAEECARKTTSDKEPYARTLPALFSLPLFSHTLDFTLHVHTNFPHLLSLFSFSTSTHLCTKNTPKTHPSSLDHTQKCTHKHTLMGEWMCRKESLSLQQLPVHSYHYNNSEWH